MLRATLVGWGALLVSLGAVITIAGVSKSARAPGKALLIISVAMLAVHPGLWLGTTSGDCGFLRLYTSIAVAVLHVALAVPAVLSARR